MRNSTIEDRVETAKAHLQKSVEWKGEWLGILEMRKHYSHYFKGIPHFKETRLKLVTCDDYKELIALLEGVR